MISCWKAKQLINQVELESGELLLIWNENCVAGLKGKNGCTLANRMKVTRQNMKYLGFFFSLSLIWIFKFHSVCVRVIVPHDPRGHMTHHMCTIQA